MPLGERPEGAYFEPPSDRASVRFPQDLAVPARGLGSPSAPRTERCRTMQIGICINAAPLKNTSSAADHAAFDTVANHDLPVNILAKLEPPSFPVDRRHVDIAAANVGPRKKEGFGLDTSCPRSNPIRQVSGVRW